MRYASTVDAFMTQNDISNRGLARTTGIDRKHIQLIRSGVVSPTEGTLERIASGAAQILGRDIGVADVVGAGHRRRKAS